MYSKLGVIGSDYGGKVAIERTDVLMKNQEGIYRIHISASDRYLECFLEPLCYVETSYFTTSQCETS